MIAISDAYVADELGADLEFPSHAGNGGALAADLAEDRKCLAGPDGAGTFCTCEFPGKVMLKRVDFKDTSTPVSTYSISSAHLC